MPFLLVRFLWANKENERLAAATQVKIAFKLLGFVPLPNLQPKQISPHPVIRCQKRNAVEPQASVSGALFFGSFLLDKQKK